MNYRLAFTEVDPERSKTMSRIRCKGNRSTERKVRAVLVRAGIRGWQMHVASVEGRPDFFFKKKKLAVFIDGCFWHGCTKCYRRPKSRQKYWDWKVKRNRKRDLLVNKALKRNGFRFIRFWEHDAQTSLHRVLARILILLAD